MAVASYMNLAMMLIWHAMLCQSGRVRIAQVPPDVAVYMILAGFVPVAVFLLLLFKPPSGPRTGESGFRLS